MSGVKDLADFGPVPSGELAAEPKTVEEIYGSSMVKLINVSALENIQVPVTEFQVGSPGLVVMHGRSAYVKAKIPPYSDKKEYTEVPAWQAVMLLRHYSAVLQEADAVTLARAKNRFELKQKGELPPPTSATHLAGADSKSELLAKLPTNRWTVRNILSFAEANGIDTPEKIYMGADNKPNIELLLSLVNTAAKAIINSGGSINFGKTGNA